MDMLRCSAVALFCLLVLPAASFAQAALTGVVKDASGAVLPGVTVEAASPVLIEKIPAGESCERREVSSEGSQAEAGHHRW